MSWLWLGDEMKTRVQPHDTPSCDDATRVIASKFVALLLTTRNSHNDEHHHRNWSSEVRKKNGGRRYRVMRAVSIFWSGAFVVRLSISHRFCSAHRLMIKAGFGRGGWCICLLLISQQLSREILTEGMLGQTQCLRNRRNYYGKPPCIMVEKMSILCKPIL